MKFFSSSFIKPQGWLKKQLEIQANGLNGNLDKIWPDVKDSKWIGGDREGWERVPYWLDGFIPLAFLLDDKDMQNRAKKYVDKIIEGQCDDGWICPCSQEDRRFYDMWGLFIILKALVVWQDCSGDDRIEEVVYNALKCAFQHFKSISLFNWASARWYECIIAIKFIYERRPEKWLIDFAHYLYSTGFDYDKPMAIWENSKNNGQNYATHVVNTAMGIKAKALYESLVPNKTPTGDCADELLKYLTEHHGTVTGHFSGDECLSGLSPIAGTELCGIVEAMYSYELLLSITGESRWGDRLEFLAFNALPATISEDMWTHQYDQLVNQTACYPIEKVHYISNSSESNAFGLEPNFGCCTANFGQGFPKLALSAFMHDNKSVYSSVLIPSSLNCELNGKKITVDLKTDYPFNNELNYTINGGEFDFYIRIPKFVESFTVNGKTEKAKDGWYKICKEWNNDQVKVIFNYTPKLIKRPKNLYSILNGALLFSVKLEDRFDKKEYVKDDVERKFPYCDYYIYPCEDWGFAFNLVNFDDTVATQTVPFAVKFNKDYTNAFSRSNPPVTLCATISKINWGTKDGTTYLCNDYPTDLTPTSETFVRELVPYGCTYLRMTEMPVIKK